VSIGGYGSRKGEKPLRYVAVPIYPLFAWYMYRYELCRSFWKMDKIGNFQKLKIAVTEWPQTELVHRCSMVCFEQQIAFIWMFAWQPDGLLCEP
jgi:hypothetical protein